MNNRDLADALANAHELGKFKGKAWLGRDGRNLSTGATTRIGASKKRTFSPANDKLKG